MNLLASVAGMVDSERMLPSQFYPAAADSPERALMRTVLQQAVSDLADPRLLSHNSARSRERTRREAEAWFTSEDDSCLYSFVSICQALNLDAGAIRRVLMPQREAA